MRLLDQVDSQAEMERELFRGTLFQATKRTSILCCGISHPLRRLMKMGKDGLVRLQEKYLLELPIGRHLTRMIKEMLEHGQVMHWGPVALLELRKACHHNEALTPQPMQKQQMALLLRRRLQSQQNRSLPMAGAADMAEEAALALLGLALKGILRLVGQVVPQIREAQEMAGLVEREARVEMVVSSYFTIGRNRLKQESGKTEMERFSSID